MVTVLRNQKVIQVIVIANVEATRIFLFCLIWYNTFAGAGGI